MGLTVRVRVRVRLGFGKVGKMGCAERVRKVLVRQDGLGLGEPQTVDEIQYGRGKGLGNPYHSNPPREPANSDMSSSWVVPYYFPIARSSRTVPTPETPMSESRRTDGHCKKPHLAC